MAFQVVIERTISGGTVQRRWIALSSILQGKRRWIGGDFFHGYNSEVLRELPPCATKRWVAAVRRLVDRYTRNPARHKGALRTATIKRRPKKNASLRWRLALSDRTGLLNPTAECAAMGRDYSPVLADASQRDFLGCFTTWKAKRRTNYLIFTR